MNLQFNFSLFNRQHSLLGLDIGSSSVKMVELSAVKKDEYRLESYAIETLDKDDVSDDNIVNTAGVANAIRRAWQRLATPTHNLAMSLPTAAVITKKISIFNERREKDLEIQIEAELIEHIPFALNEVNYDFQILGESEDELSTVTALIAACRKERVDERVVLAETAGLKAAILDVESYAQQRAFTTLISNTMPHRGQTRIALIEIGSNTLRTLIFSNDEIIYSRDQVFGGRQLTQDIARRCNLKFSEAESLKKGENLTENHHTELVQPFIQNMAQEVSRAIQFFLTSTQYPSVEHIVLAGGCAAISGAAEAVASQTKVSTSIANPFAKMRLSSHIQPKQLISDAPSLLVCCGLALRKFDIS